MNFSRPKQLQELEKEKFKELYDEGLLDKSH